MRPPRLVTAGQIRGVLACAGVAGSVRPKRHPSYGSSRCCMPHPPHVAKQRHTGKDTRRSVLQIRDHLHKKTPSDKHGRAFAMFPALLSRNLFFLQHYSACRLPRPVQWAAHGGLSWQRSCLYEKKKGVPSAAHVLRRRDNGRLRPGGLPGERAGRPPRHPCKKNLPHDTARGRFILWSRRRDLNPQPADDKSKKWLFPGISRCFPIARFCPVSSKETEGYPGSSYSLTFPCPPAASRKKWGQNGDNVSGAHTLGYQWHQLEEGSRVREHPTRKHGSKRTHSWYGLRPYSCGGESAFVSFFLQCVLLSSKTIHGAVWHVR